MHQVRAGFVEWRGRRLAYEVRGSGQRPFVLLPGLLLPMHLNGQIATLLVDEGNTVILVDPIGQGRSDKPRHATEYRMDRGPEQVVAVLDELGIDQAVVGGVSLGANFALMMATTHPDRMRAAVCEMPVLERGTIGSLWVFGPLLAFLRFAGRPVRLLSRFVGLLPRPAHEPAAALLDTLGDPREMAAVLHGYLAGPVCPPIAERMQISTPMMVIGHRGDWIHPMDDAEALAAEVPTARLVASRSPFELRIRPKRLIAEISAFLDEVWSEPVVAEVDDGAP